MCGYDKKAAKYVLAEGADGSSMTRTIDIERAMDDCIVAWGMNGEMLRPENGYPLRLVVPGIQGVSWVKYLRRIEVGDQKWAAKDEAVHYIDHMPDGTHRQYTGIQECKSVITTPSGSQTLLDKGDDFGLLSVCGTDLPGAVYVQQAPLDNKSVADVVTQGNDALEMTVTPVPLPEATSLSGVQPKLSLVQAGGRYVARTKDAKGVHIIAKLPTVEYPLLPQTEELSMRMDSGHERHDSSTGTGNALADSAPTA